MSKAVKVVAGMALIYFSGGLAGGLTYGAGGFTAGMAGAYSASVGVSLWSAAITLVGASLAGSALAPEMPDTLGADAYAGQKLQTKRDNVSAVPIIFGENRVGSNVIWQGTSPVESGAPNKDYWSVQIVAEGEVEDYLTMYQNENTMVKNGDVFTAKYAQVKAYKTSGSGMLLSDIDFVRREDGTLIGGGEVVGTFSSGQLSSNTNTSELPNLLDGDTETYWENGSGQSPIEPCWIEIDASEAITIDSLGILFYKRENKKAKFRIECWDGATWQSGSDWATIAWGSQASHTWYNISSNIAGEKAKWRLYFEYLYNDWDSDYTTPIKIMELDISSNYGQNLTLPANVAFIATHQIFDATDNNHTQLDNITATLQGKKINDIKDDVANNNIYYFPSGTYSSSSSSESNLFDGNISTTGYRVAGDNLSLDMDNRIQFNSTSPSNQTLIISAEIYIKTDIGLGIFAKDADGTSFGDPVVVSAGYEGWITLDNSDALDWYSEEELSDYWDIIFTGSGTGSDLEVEIREIRNVEWLERDYSYNPASQVLNLLTKGLNIPPISIDYPSFINASQKCSSYGYSSNIVFNSQRNIQSCIVDILATCRGQIVLSQGKWKLKIDEKGSSVAKALTVGDILNGSLNVSMKGFQEIANKIELKYIEPNDNWLSAKASKEDSDLIAMDGQSNVKTLDIKGVTNSLQANKLAEITLNSMRYTEDAEGNRIKQAPLAISFATTVKNAELEVGDVFELQHDLLDRDRKFITLSVETDQSGAMKIAAREYCETHYKNSAGVYLI